jgi:hypothetical protein
MEQSPVVEGVVYSAAPHLPPSAAPPAGKLSRVSSQVKVPEEEIARVIENAYKI